MTDYTDLLARLREPIIGDAHGDGLITSGRLAERLIRERGEAADAITALQAEVARLRNSFGLHLAVQIESAAREHRNTFPGEEYKAANIALGGLRRLASEFFPETRQMCNEDAAKHLRALTAPKHPTPDAPQPPQ